MNASCSGVAGFFEDLPVLIFVLSGVVAMVLTGVFVSERLAAARMDQQLDEVATRIVDSVVAELLFSSGPDTPPTTAFICAFNYSDMACQFSEGRAFSLSVFSLHPSFCQMVNVCSTRGDTPRSSGYASEMLNALSDDGLCMVLEVRAVVW
jgi:hypothetical protein